MESKKLNTDISRQTIDRFYQINNFDNRQQELPLGKSDSGLIQPINI